MTEETQPAQAGQVERPVRPLVDAYEDHCGVERGRFDACSLAEMEDGAAFAGFDEFAAGWCAAVEAAIKEAERLCFALDHGGNPYRRPSNAETVVAVLRLLRPNAEITGRQKRSF